MGRILCVDRVALSAGEERSPAGARGADAADLLRDQRVNLSNEVCEDTIYDVAVFPAFCRFNFG